MEFDQDVLINKIENDIELSEEEDDFIKSEVIQATDDLIRIYYEYLNENHFDLVYNIYDIEYVESQGYYKCLMDFGLIKSDIEYFTYDGNGCVVLLTEEQLIQRAIDDMPNYYEKWLELYTEL